MVVAAKAELIRYYEGDTKIMEKSVVQSVRKADAILVARMALIMMGKRKKEFIISAAGSSVTAGHGGFGSLAWPAFLERQLAPVWKALGVDFQVRNVAVGGRNPNPWAFCTVPMFGNDADVVMREWEYWDFNTGIQNAAKEGGEETKAAIEILLQNSLRMAKQPAVHFVKMSIDAKSGGKLGWMKTWFNKGGDLEVYKDFSLLGFDNFGAPFAHLRKKAPKTRRNKADDADCSGNNVNECPVDLLKQDGYHLTANYTDYIESRPQWKELVCIMT
jgi:hypothetical protein